MKELILFRGVPGSGKTTLAKMLSDHVASADDFFYEIGKGEYAFDSSLLGHAHAACRAKVAGWMLNEVPRIAVANTFTREWEMENYFILAREHGYRVHTLVCENRHGGQNEHNVPEEAIEKMRNRFEVKL